MEQLSSEVLQLGTQNRTLHLFAHLNRNRNHRERTGLFAMEGLRLITDAIQSGVRLQALLLTEAAAQTYGATFRTEAPAVRTLLLSEALAKEVADTETAQGVFAIAEMVAEKPALPAKQSRCLLLHSVQDPSNLGAILRTAEALGTDGVMLYHCCDLYNPKTVRSSMGAMFRIPFARLTDLPAFLQHCRQVGLPLCATVVDRQARHLQSFAFSDGAVVCIGNEGNGLPPEFVSDCDVSLTIPMAPASNSLNAAMAAGIVLWEMMRNA